MATKTTSTVTTQRTRILLDSEEVYALLRKHFERELSNDNISVEIDCVAGYLRGVVILATTVTHS